MGGDTSASTDLRQLLERRAQQLSAFERWEEAQQRAAGPPDDADVRRNLAWLNDAHELAVRMGSTGPAVPEQHLEDLIHWVKRWRRAWRAD
jgi:hypothetical protein